MWSTCRLSSIPLFSVYFCILRTLNIHNGTLLQYILSILLHTTIEQTHSSILFQYIPSILLHTTIDHNTIHVCRDNNYNPAMLVEQSVRLSNMLNWQICAWQVQCVQGLLWWGGGAIGLIFTLPLNLIKNGLHKILVSLAFLLYKKKESLLDELRQAALFKNACHCCLITW